MQRLLAVQRDMSAIAAVALSIPCCHCAATTLPAKGCLLQALTRCSRHIRHLPRPSSAQPRARCRRQQQPNLPAAAAAAGPSALPQPWIGQMRQDQSHADLPGKCQIVWPPGCGWHWTAVRLGGTQHPHPTCTGFEGACTARGMSHELYFYLAVAVYGQLWCLFCRIHRCAAAANEHSTGRHAWVLIAYPSCVALPCVWGHCVQLRAVHHVPVQLSQAVGTCCAHSQACQCNGLRCSTLPSC